MYATTIPSMTIQQADSTRTQI